MQLSPLWKSSNGLHDAWIIPIPLMQNGKVPNDCLTIRSPRHSVHRRLNVIIKPLLDLTEAAGDVSGLFISMSNLERDRVLRGVYVFFIVILVMLN